MKQNLLVFNFKDLSRIYSNNEFKSKLNTKSQTQGHLHSNSYKLKI